MTNDSRDLDIFELLKHCKDDDESFYDSLTPAQQAKFAPIVALRWASGTKNAKQIMRLNSILNPLVFGLYKEKKLLYMLLVACTDTNSCKWVKKKGKDKPDKNIVHIANYYECNYETAEQYAKIIGKDGVDEIISQMGQEKIK